MDLPTCRFHRFRISTDRRTRFHFASVLLPHAFSRIWNASFLFVLIGNEALEVSLNSSPRAYGRVKIPPHSSAQASKLRNPATRRQPVAKAGCLAFLSSSQIFRAALFASLTFADAYPPMSSIDSPIEKRDECMYCSSRLNATRGFLLGLRAKIHDVHINAEAHVVGKIPAGMIRIFIDNDFIGIP